MEFCENGELFDYITSKKRLDEQEACRIFQQVLCGVTYFHQSGVCHRDLKLENLLLDEQNNIKIIDFGLGDIYEAGQRLQKACGSPCYAAPEMIFKSELGYQAQAVDLWSVGVVLFALVHGYLPFEDENDQNLYRKIKNACFTFKEEVSAEVKDLIRRILQPNPGIRYNIDSVMEHPWYFNYSGKLESGIIVNQQTIPIDDDIVRFCIKKYKLNEQQLIEDINENRFSDATVIYYLSLKQKQFNRLPYVDELFQEDTFNDKDNTEDVPPNQHLTFNSVEQVLRSRESQPVHLHINDVKNLKSEQISLEFLKNSFDDEDQKSTNQLTNKLQSIQTYDSHQLPQPPSQKIITPKRVLKKVKLQQQPLHMMAPIQYQQLPFYPMNNMYPVMPQFFPMHPQNTTIQAFFNQPIDMPNQQQVPLRNQDQQFQTNYRSSSTNQNRDYSVRYNPKLKRRLVSKKQMRAHSTNQSPFDQSYNTNPVQQQNQYSFLSHKQSPLNFSGFTEQLFSDDSRHPSNLVQTIHNQRHQTPQTRGQNQDYWNPSIYLPELQGPGLHSRRPSDQRSIKPKIINGQVNMTVNQTEREAYLKRRVKRRHGP